MTIVAKLSSVRIIVAASFETSVPVIPIAMPMSALFSAGASFTPSPVIATMSPFRFSESTRRTLSSGATRAITPMSSIAASSSSSDIALNSAPVIALPGMPSSLAIAAAVTAWSPVIIRTLDPGRVRGRDRRLRRRPRRVDDADEREHGQAVEQREQVGRRIERRPASKSLRPVAITRRPWLARRSFSSM